MRGRLPFVRHVMLAPYDLYASPGWIGELSFSTVSELVALLQGLGTRGFVWNVRFDQNPLASALQQLGLAGRRKPCLVMPLGEGYERVFARFSATTRNHVRKSRRRGVSVRDVASLDDIHAYYEVYMRLVNAKQEQGGYGVVYPIGLFLDLYRLPNSGRLLLAEYEGEVVSCGLFLRDGCSVFYFHGASDRSYTHLFPACAVLDEAIRWGCDIGAEFFNLTDSGGIESLERFKASWGAHREFNWKFEWQNPFWIRASKISASVRSRVRAVS